MYSYEQELGKGGMGTVWRATHLPTRETVAIKLMNAELLANPKKRASLEAEVHAMARLQHPGVVGVLDYGRTDKDEPYIVMECADATLSQLKSVPTWRRFKALLYDILDALAFAQPEVFQSWIVAAVLGLSVRREEWLAACNRLGIEADYAWFENLVQRDLGRRQVGGFSFTNPQIRDCLILVGEESGLLRDAHSASADALLKLFPRPPATVCTRITKHMVRSHRAQDALAPLYLAILRSNGIGDERDAVALLKLRQETLERLSHPADSRERLQQAWLSVEVSSDHDGDLDEPIQMARRQGFQNELAYMLRTKGKMFSGADRNQQGLDLLHESDIYFREVDNKKGLFANQLTRVHHLAEMGKEAQALVEAERSFYVADAYPPLHWRRATALASAMAVTIQQGNFKAAMEYGERALKYAQMARNRLAEGSVHNNLGELSRAAGDYQKALVHYKASRDLDELQGASAHVVSDLNIAMTYLLLGENESAYQILSTKIGPWYRGYVVAAFIAAAVVCQKPQEFELAFAEFIELERNTISEQDVLTMLDIAISQLWDERAKTTLCGRAIEIAGDLNDEDAVRKFQLLRDA